MYHLHPKRLVWFTAAAGKFRQIPAKPSNFDTDEWDEQCYVCANQAHLAFSERPACMLAAFAEKLRRTRRKPTTICSRSKSNAIET
jgi:hypothetical protein